MLFLEGVDDKTINMQQDRTVSSILLLPEDKTPQLVVSWLTQTAGQGGCSCSGLDRDRVSGRCSVHMFPVPVQVGKMAGGDEAQVAARVKMKEANVAVREHGRDQEDPLVREGDEALVKEGVKADFQQEAVARIGTLGVG